MDPNGNVTPSSAYGKQDRKALKILYKSKRFKDAFFHFTNWGHLEDIRKFYGRLDRLQKSAFVSIGLRTEKVFKNGGMRVLPEFLDEKDVIASLLPEIMKIPGKHKESDIVFLTGRKDDCFKYIATKMKEIDIPLEALVESKTFAEVNTQEGTVRAFNYLIKNDFLVGCSVEHFINIPSFCKEVNLMNKRLESPKSFLRKWNRDANDAIINHYWGKSNKPLTQTRPDELTKMLLLKVLKLAVGNLSIRELVRCPDLRYFLRKSILNMLEKTENSNLVSQLTLLAHKRQKEFSFYDDLKELAAVIIASGDHRLIRIFERMFPSQKHYRTRVSTEMFECSSGVLYPYSPYFIAFLYEDKKLMKHYQPNEPIPLQQLIKAAAFISSRPKVKAEDMCKYCKDTMEYAFNENGFGLG